MDDSIAGLRAFVALADAGGFTAAGRGLGLSRSAVSKAVTRLEHRLDTRLVERSSRALQLTEEGRALHLQGRRVLAELAAAQALFERPDEVQGVVRLAVPPLFGRLRVMPVLHGLARRYPGIAFDVDFSRQASELVADGVDIALRIGVLADRAEWVARPLGLQPVMLCAAPQYLAQHPAPEAPGDLMQHSCLLLERPWTPGDGLHMKNGQFCLRDTAALLDAALAGHGIAQLPAWLAQPHLAAATLVQVLPQLALPALPINLLWPRGRHLPRRARVVIDALASELGQP